MTDPQRLAFRMLLLRVAVVLFGGAKQSLPDNGTHPAANGVAFTRETRVISAVRRARLIRR